MQEMMRSRHYDVMIRPFRRFFELRPLCRLMFTDKIPHSTNHLKEMTPTLDAFILTERLRLRPSGMQCHPHHASNAYQVSTR